MLKAAILIAILAVTAKMSGCNPMPQTVPCCGKCPVGRDCCCPFPFACFPYDGIPSMVYRVPPCLRSPSCCQAGCQPYPCPASCTSCTRNIASHACCNGGRTFQDLQHKYVRSRHLVNQCW